MRFETQPNTLRAASAAHIRQLRGIRYVVMFAAAMGLQIFCSGEALAFDSYRYLHVTIDTPWAIFLILLPIILSPFILMAFLYWRFANRRAQQQKDAESVDADSPSSRS